MSKKARISGGTGYRPPKNNLTATSTPGATNDITEGYKVNSLWFDTSVSPVNVYRCVDNTEDNAVWVETTVETSELDTWFAAKTTNDLSEDTNLYFTTARVDSHLSGGTGIDYSSGTISIADNGVTLAKMASGTDGNLITFDSNGDPAYVSTGTATQVLTSNGAGSVPTFQDASGGGSGLPQLMPENMSLDDTDSESSRGSAFSMIDDQFQFKRFY